VRITGPASGADAVDEDGGRGGGPAGLSEVGSGRGFGPGAGFLSGCGRGNWVLGEGPGVVPDARPSPPVEPPSPEPPPPSPSPEPPPPFCGLVESFPAPESFPALDWEADVVAGSPEVPPLASSAAGDFLPLQAATVSQVMTRSVIVRIDRVVLLDRFRPIAAV
jgi:hypothetical protein